MKNDFEIQVEASNSSPQEAELRLYKALEILISEEDIINYLSLKNYEINRKKI